MDALRNIADFIGCILLMILLVIPTMFFLVVAGIIFMIGIAYNTVHTITFKIIKG